MRKKHRPDRDGDRNCFAVSGAPSVAPAVHHAFTDEGSRDVSSPKLLVNGDK